MRIRWTQPAADGLTRIYDYVEKHDTQATRRGPNRRSTSKRTETAVFHPNIMR